jgi:hypothetical protein
MSRDIKKVETKKDRILFKKLYSIILIVNLKNYIV